MHIDRVLKIYFIFVMTITSMAIVGQSTGMAEVVGSSYASVMNSFDAWVSEDDSESHMDLEELDLSDFLNENQFDYVEMNQLVEQSYAYPGTDGAALAEVVVEGEKRDVEIEIGGVEAKMLGDFILINGEDYIKPKVSDNKLLFRDVEPGKTFVLRTDLARELTSGERIKLTLHGQSVPVNRYVSIVQR